MLHEHGVDGVVRVELSDGAQKVGLGGVVGKMNVRRVEVELGRLLLLDADVADARALVADEDRAQPGTVTVLDEFADAWGQLGERRFGHGRAWHHLRRHQCRNCRSPVSTIASPSSSARAMFSSSRTEPPGCTTTATPASAAASTPSANG